MPRQESDREDLFAELAALSPRIEIRVGDAGRTVCAGRRESTGGWSLYLSADRVYHFDDAGRLRRAFLDGLLYRSEGATLARLRRARYASETLLLSHDLESHELVKFIAEMRTAVGQFLNDLRGHSFQVLRVSTPDEDVPAQLERALVLVLHAAAPLAPALRR